MTNQAGNDKEDAGQPVGELTALLQRPIKNHDHNEKITDDASLVQMLAEHSNVSFDETDLQELNEGMNIDNFADALQIIRHLDYTLVVLLERGGEMLVEAISAHFGTPRSSDAARPPVHAAVLGGGPPFQLTDAWKNWVDGTMDMAWRVMCQQRQFRDERNFCWTTTTTPSMATSTTSPWRSSTMRAGDAMAFVTRTRGLPGEATKTTESCARRSMRLQPF